MRISNKDAFKYFFPKSSFQQKTSSYDGFPLPVELFFKPSAVKPLFVFRARITSWEMDAPNQFAPAWETATERYPWSRVYTPIVSSRKKARLLIHSFRRSHELAINFPNQKVNTSAASRRTSAPDNKSPSPSTRTSARPCATKPRNPISRRSTNVLTKATGDTIPVSTAFSRVSKNENTLYNIRQRKPPLALWKPPNK